MNAADKKKLKMGFAGRIIDHLSLQMYQSPAASLAEIVSNAWDADATKVDISLNLDSTDHDKWSVVIKDNGIWMTFKECEEKYLNVGYDKRGWVASKTTSAGRKFMGRKGIGKFAWFWIAEHMSVNTVSKETWERTFFRLSLDQIRNGDASYVWAWIEIDVTEYEDPNDSQKASCGTIITLTWLTIDQRISDSKTISSLARKFVANMTGSDFIINVDGKSVSTSIIYPSSVRYSFPTDYRDEDGVPKKTCPVDSEWWWTEIVDWKEVKWKIMFLDDTIKDDELRWVSIFAHGKLAQTPFMFNLSWGLITNAWPEYMTGMVIADYVDEFPKDVISTERQRLNWSRPEIKSLEEWGQTKVKSLLYIWKKRATEAKENTMEWKISEFWPRFEKLGREWKVVKLAVKKLASVDMSQEKFVDTANAMIRAFESWRLRGLIEDMSNVSDMNETELVRLLIDSNAIQALHTAESVKAKLDAISWLEKRIETRELENAVRDYLAKNPWLISPEWETFAVEKSMENILKKIAKEALDNVEIGQDFAWRMDLVLSSWNQLLVLEFMRPWLKVDVDHVFRFEQYVLSIRAYLSTTKCQFKHVAWYLVADSILKTKPAMFGKLQNLKNEDMYCMEWVDLLAQAQRQWKDFLDNVEKRVDDARIREIIALPESISKNPTKVDKKISVVKLVG